MRKFMVGDTEWTGEESDAALVESTRKAGNVVHVAEAASAELIDPSREIGVRSHRAGAQCEIAATPACVEPRPRADPAVSGAGAGVARPSATRCSSSTPMARCDASRRWCRWANATIPSLSLAATHGGGRDSALPRSASIRANARRSCHGAARRKIANGQPTFTLVSFYDLFLRAAADPRRAEARYRSVAVQGSHRHRRRQCRRACTRSFTTPFPEGEINGPEVHANVADALLANRSIVRSPGVGRRWR